MTASLKTQRIRNIRERLAKLEEETISLKNELEKLEASSGAAVAKSFLESIGLGLKTHIFNPATIEKLIKQASDFTLVETTASLHCECQRHQLGEEIYEFTYSLDDAHLSLQQIYELQGADGISVSKITRKN